MCSLPFSVLGCLINLPKVDQVRVSWPNIVSKGNGCITACLEVLSHSCSILSCEQLHLCYLCLTVLRSPPAHDYWLMFLYALGSVGGIWDWVLMPDALIIIIDAPHQFRRGTFIISEQHYKHNKILFM